MGTVLGKRALVFVGWTALGGLCAIAFGLVTGIVRPDEKVNALWLVVAAACFYVLAYRFYGRFLARRVLVLDDRRPTPAHRLGDGANFTPTNRWVLFGHHFAAIAGAGPLLGPVLAAQFGFLPGFLWLVIGAVLVPGSRAPKVVNRKTVGRMKKGAVIVDVSVDQGGCIETIHPTSHSDPIYFVDGVLHYAVPNMPGIVPQTSTFALTNVSFPFILRLAELGPEQAVRSDPALAKGLNLARGRVTCPGVAEAFGMPYHPGIGA